MEYNNSLSLVKRHDGSFFYIKELFVKRGLYKYIISDWQTNKLGKPIIVYSHTKRSNLTKVEQEYFDNNLLNKKRLNKYLDTNLYVGGISRNNERLVREFKEDIIIIPNYKQYIRNNNYIIIELNGKQQIYEYSIYEFIDRKTAIDYQCSHPIYSEKNLLKLNKEEKEYVLNNLLAQKRIEDKIENENGYVGSVEILNGKYKKVANPIFLKKSKF